VRFALNEEFRAERSSGERAPQSRISLPRRPKSDEESPYPPVRILITRSHHQFGAWRGVLAALITTLQLVAAPARAAEPVDSQLPKYNINWTSASTSITGGMPIGNGRVGALVWAEDNGDLHISLAMGDSWDENARSIRLGNLKVSLTPNPFSGGSFAQVLKYKEGETTILAGNPAVTFRIWVDANHPVVHLEANAGSPFSMKVTPELWRTARQDVSNNTPWKDFIHVAEAVRVDSSTLSVVLTPDLMVTGLAGKVGFYHRNETSHWADTMTNQSIDVASFGVKDPLTHRTSGAILQGVGLAPSGAGLASSQAQSSFRVDIACNTEIADQAATWQSHTDEIATAVFATDITTLRAAHQQYWNDFWNRSYVFVTGDTDAQNVTSGWIAARYLEACQGRAEGPIEFNGGLFTFQNDTKLWHDYTQANMRFAHYGMLPSGDFDLIQPWFDMNVAAISVARAKSKAMWKHDGVMLAEHWIIYGPQSGTHYGWDRTGHDPSFISDGVTRTTYGGILETTALMLDYFEYTGDTAFVTNKLLPFVSQVVKWYDLHWARVGGKLSMTPTSSGEKDRGVTNSMVDVAGLTKAVNGLLALPAALTTQADRDHWTSFRAELPALPVSGGRLRPAQSLAVGLDTENQNLDAIFPLRFYGTGLPDLQTAIDSYNNRTGQTPRDGREAWRHDACHAAYLGLAAEAKAKTVLAFTNYKYRYIGFVNGSPDGDTCIEPLGIGKIGLQAMVMHPGAGKSLNLMNAWPSGWNAQFKLWGPQKTWVAGEISGGKLGNVTVSPASRIADILVNGAAPSGTPITGSDDPGGFINGSGGVMPTGGTGGSGAGGGGSSSGSAGTNAGGSAVAGGAAPTGAAGNFTASMSGGAGTAGNSAGSGGSLPAKPEKGAAPDASGCACTLAESERPSRDPRAWSIATLMALGLTRYRHRNRRCAEGRGSPDGETA
jgi:alpha-L-fucosidase 2